MSGEDSTASDDRSDETTRLRAVRRKRVVLENQLFGPTRKCAKNHIEKLSVDVIAAIDAMGKLGALESFDAVVLERLPHRKKMLLVNGLPAIFQTHAHSRYVADAR